MRLLKTDKWLVVLLVGGGVALAAGIAYAAIPDSQGVIHSCYTKSAGALRVVDTATSCKSGETALAWNQAGAQGRPGPPGPAGSLQERTISAFGPGPISKSVILDGLGTISVSCTPPDPVNHRGEDYRFVFTADAGSNVILSGDASGAGVGANISAGSSQSLNGVGDVWFFIDSNGPAWHVHYLEATSTVACDIAVIATAAS